LIGRTHERNKERGAVMPITPYLESRHESRHFDAEAKRVMGVAFELARWALRPPGRDDAITEVVAEKIIELAKAGERNPDLLCENALDHLRGIVRATLPASASRKPERR
jgi:hypothetical protein